MLDSVLIRAWAGCGRGHECALSRDETGWVEMWLKKEIYAACCSKLVPLNDYLH